MRNLSNIEKSGFRRGEYVGYSAGLVWKIRKLDQWYALPTSLGTRAFSFPEIKAPTLAKLSESLSALTCPPYPAHHRCMLPAVYLASNGYRACAAHVEGSMCAGEALGTCDKVIFD